MAGYRGALDVNSLRLFLLDNYAPINGFSHQLRKKCCLITMPLLPKHRFRLCFIPWLILCNSDRRDCYSLYSSFIRLIGTFSLILEIKFILPLLWWLRTTRCLATVLLHWWSLICWVGSFVDEMHVLGQLFVSFVETVLMAACQRTVITI